MEKEKMNHDQLTPEEQERLEKEKKAVKQKKAAKIMAVTGLCLMLIGLLCRMLYLTADEPHGVIRQETTEAEADVAEAEGHENWENATMPVFMEEEMDTVAVANPNREHYYLQYKFYDAVSGDEITHTGLIDHGDVEYIHLASKMGLKSGQEAEVKCVTYVIYDDDNTMSPQTLEQTFKLYKI